LAFWVGLECAPDSPPESIELEAFCSPEAGETMFCKKYQSCGLISQHIACRPSWKEREAARIQECPEGARLSLDAGRIRFDGERAAACLRELSLQCGSGNRACDDAIVGLVPMGGPCVAMECANGLTCDSSTCPSTCQPQKCLGQVLLEDGGCGSWPTPQLVSLGGSCTANSPCQEGMRCSEGVCVLARAKEGEACDQSFVTERWCQEGLVCLQGRCARGAAPGEACSRDLACQVDAFCGSDGGCVLAATEARSLPPSAGSTCAADLDCVNGLVTLRCEAGRCVRVCT
jgi:hypothetical protein